MKSKSKAKIIEVEVVKPGQVVKAEPVKLKEFDAARTLIADIRDLGQRAQHKSLLLGFELNKLKLELGVKHGGSRASTHGAYLKPWRELIVEQTGLSEDTCDRWMKIAKGAAKSIPILTSKDVLEKPFRELPEARQAEVEKILHKAVDGQTMHQMMLNFGVWKDKGLKHPPKPTKASAAKRKANAEDETLQAAVLMKLTEEHIETLEKITLAAAFKAADDERLHVACETSLKLCSAQTDELITRKTSTALLAAMENAVDALKQAIADELKQRRKAK